YTNSLNMGFSCLEFIGDSLVFGGWYKYLDTIEVNNIGFIRYYENNSNCFFTGLSESAVLHGLSLFPNPNNGSFTIRAEAISLNGCSISVSDMLGQTVYLVEDVQTGENDLRLSIDGLPPGIYQINISSRGR